MHTRIVAGVLFAIVATLSALSQTTPVGTIEGTVVRHGTSEPLADVQITVGGSVPVLPPRQAQAVLDAAAEGLLPGITDEFVQAAQNAARGGARGIVTRALTAVTDNAGRFIIPNVPVGNAVVRAQLQGYFGEPAGGIYPPIVTSSVTVTDRQPVQVRLSMIPGSSFSGRVLDPQGRPLSQSSVQALQSRYRNGVLTLTPVDIKVTDDRGEYRFFRLPPGEYFVSASPQRASAGLRGSASDPTSNPSAVSVLTLHPNATEATAATPVVLSSGDERSGINIQIRTAAGSTVSGRVISNVPPVAGQRGQGRPWLLMLMPRGAAALPDLTDGMTATANPTDGTFAFSNVPAGAYDVIARLPVTANTGWGAANPPGLAANPWAFGRASTEVRGNNVSDVAIVVHPGVDVKGQLLVDGKPAQANVRIGLAMDDAALRVTDAQTLNTFNVIMRFQPEIGADGSFTIPLVPEGSYRIQVNVGGVVSASAVPSLPATAYVADIRQGSVSVYDNGLSVGRESVTPIQVVVNTNGGSVEGVVVDAAGKAAPSATVVLVPATSRRRNPALYKTLPSDAQGRFLFNAVPPGQYKVFAWDSVPFGAWQNAEFLSRDEQRGTAVIVNPGLRTMVEAGSIKRISSR